MYGVYEFTVNAVVRAAVDSINAHAQPIHKLRHSLLALFLHPQLESIRNVEKRKHWESRMRLFERSCSTTVVMAPNNVIPSNGDSYRHTRLQLIFDVLGIDGLPAPSEAHLNRIDEVVENRNAIAHGTETPEDVGGRYSHVDISHRILQVKEVCLFLIEATENHCADSSHFCR